MARVRELLAAAQLALHAAKDDLPALKSEFSREAASGDQRALEAAEARYHDGLRAINRLEVAIEAHLNALPDEEIAEMAAFINVAQERADAAEAAFPETEKRLLEADAALTVARAAYDEARRARDHAQSLLGSAKGAIEKHRARVAPYRGQADRAAMFDFYPPAKREGVAA